MTLTSVIGQKQGRSYLTDFRGRHDNTCCLRLDLEELLDRCYHRNKIRVIHPLQNLKNNIFRKVTKRAENMMPFRNMLQISITDIYRRAEHSRNRIYSKFKIFDRSPSGTTLITWYCFLHVFHNAFP